jgi:hypothetical protein
MGRKFWFGNLQKKCGYQGVWFVVILVLMVATRNILTWSLTNW